MHSSGLVLVVLAIACSLEGANAQTATRYNNDNNQFFDKNIVDEETALSEEDFAAARSQIRTKRETDENVDDSAMYNSDRFEGDIANLGLASQNVGSFIGDVPAVPVQGVQRNAVRSRYQRWPDARIPYTISSQYTALSRQILVQAFDEYTKNTCIQFVPREASDTEYIHIMPDDGCYSLVGRTGGRQILSLGDGCIQKGIVIHEMMHTVGFFHEQSRADRDDYIRINWENVENGLQDQFDKYSLSMIDHLGTQYDYGSIMHYAKNAFSKNRKPTIEPRQAGVTIGQRRGFSHNDLYKINKLYNCPQMHSVAPSTSSSSSSSTSTGTTSSSWGSLGNPAPTKKPVPCQDRRADCFFMARGGNCEYRYAKRFMEANCPSSCNLCDDTKKVACADEKSWCSRWASTGMCSNPVFNDYMSAKCQFSCGQC